MNRRLYRWETPGHYDQLPHGTEIVRLKSVLYNEAELFVQTSRDQSNPMWTYRGIVSGSTASLDSSAGDRAEE